MPYPLGDLLHPEIKPVFPALAGGLFTPEPPGKPLYTVGMHKTPVLFMEKSGEISGKGKRLIHKT